MNGFRIATVEYGCFAEYIPQTGIIELDSVERCHNVKVIIDELYLSKISIGLKGITTINNTDYALAITNVHPAINEGRFNIDMNFCGEIPSEVFDGKSLRLRIELSDPSNELLLPVGSFYKDTGGRWIFVVENGNLAVRRNIQLGRKMGPEYFTVVGGLKPGEQVITSSYEKFNHLDSIDVLDLKKLHQM
jgi:HlyD family secretion protein